MNEPRPTQPERNKTDQSLRTERTRTDRAIADAGAVAEQVARDVVEHARGLAKQVVIVAREKADAIADPGEAAGPAAAVARQRAIDDTTVEQEQAIAEEQLRLEGEDRASRAAMVPLEREKTDRNLLTERVRSDAALAHRDDFLGIVAHDVRNLVMGVVMTATVLAMQASDSVEGRRTIEGTKRIKRYGARMTRLIGDLVDVESLDRGTFALARAQCDARLLLVDAVETFSPIAAEKGVALAIEHVDAPLEVIMITTGSSRFSPT